MKKSQEDKKRCKICGRYCFNKLPSSIYCKKCAEVGEYLNRSKSNLKVRAKAKFPNYEFRMTSKFKKKD